MEAGNLKDVVQAGVCVGCGACAAADPRVQMQRTPLGFMQPVLGPVQEGGDLGRRLAGLPLL